MKNTDSAKNIAPFGTWDSPIKATMLTQQSVKLSQPSCTDQHLFWLESRPWEKGRSVLVQQDADGNNLDLTPANMSVRSRVNEYGGGDYCLSADAVFFINATDQQIYQQSLAAPDQTHRITKKSASRFADIIHKPGSNQLIAIEEEFPKDDSESVHRLVNIDLANGQIAVLAEGADFYASPALSPCGTQLAWLSWNHPNMPWDHNSCWLGKLTYDGKIEHARVISPENSSSFQPRWSPNNQLFLVNDLSGWWNLYRYDQGALLPLLPMEAEFATPQWVFGMSCYGFLDANTIFATYTQAGQWQLCTLDIKATSGMLQPIDNAFCDISAIHCSQSATKPRAVLLAASTSQSVGVWQWHANTQANTENSAGRWQCIKPSSQHTLEQYTIAYAQPIAFPTSENQQAYGFYYPPTNEHYRAPDNEKPPLIVLSHGGPTGASESSLNLKIQYWTSRGFAVLDVNYRGSTGYGTAYRNALKGQWGIYDVDDVCAGADYLVNQGLADPTRLIIKGSSAGGYTVLAALTFRNTFNAGTSLYGIGDLTALATDTHKFESRYLDGLVAPWPQGEAIYRARSPIAHVEGLTCPVIFFQGLQDKVVPPNQAEAMVGALKQQNIKTAYVTFESEGHGFRESKSIEDQLELELAFYGEIFNIAVQPARKDIANF